MLKISRTIGRKFISINNKSGLYSTTNSVRQYLPDGGRFIPYEDGNDTKCLLEVTNQTTEKVYTTRLSKYEETERTTVFWFDYTDGLFPEKGLYDYKISEMIEDTSGNSAGTFKYTDVGLFLIYEDDTFIEQYINPDEQTIPATVVYKPS